MADHLSLQGRSSVMAAIRSKNTKPEILVRSVAFRLGYRFRLHQKNLPGCPDLVFRRLGKIIFVHGCFWHQHPETTCTNSSRPATNRNYWKPKLRRNAKRDRAATKSLSAMGWDVLVIWECELSDLQKLKSRIKKFLENLKLKAVRRENFAAK